MKAFIVPYYDDHGSSCTDHVRANDFMWLIKILQNRMLEGSLWYAVRMGGTNEERRFMLSWISPTRPLVEDRPSRVILTVLIVSTISWYKSCLDHIQPLMITYKYYEHSSL